ncbi:MAG TPA: nuclear transport factor 2 family protein [Terriglobales bacterium]|nr:nuclear transport factor 2 family protein [Terriglobales bacterium]
MRHRLALWTVLWAVVWLAGCTLWPEHRVNTWKDATGAEGLERSFWRDVKDKDWGELERHLSGNYVSFTLGEGRMDRAAALARFQQLQLQDYSLGDIQTELNGSTLVVTYTILMRGTYAGEPLPASPVRMMTVWQQQKSGWLAIAHAVSGPAQPANP